MDDVVNWGETYGRLRRSTARDANGALVQPGGAPTDSEAPKGARDARLSTPRQLNSDPRAHVSDQGMPIVETRWTRHRVRILRMECPSRDLTARRAANRRAS